MHTPITHKGGGALSKETGRQWPNEDVQELLTRLKVSVS